MADDDDFGDLYGAEPAAPKPAAKPGREGGGGPTITTHSAGS